MTEIEFDWEARPLFHSVFSNNDPFDAPFQERIRPRLLLYGFRWVLHEPWLNPIVTGMTQLGEEGFYLTELTSMFERPEQKPDGDAYHWFVPISEVGTYKAEFGPYASAICSIEGSWGLIASYEDHAIIAGSKVVVDAVRTAVPDLDNRIQEYLHLWRSHYEMNKADLGWLPGMLAHVYGPFTMRKMLEEAKLDWLLENEHT